MSNAAVEISSLTHRYGERIAASGDSGGQQRAALYFEVRKGKEPQDPRKWLAKR